MKKVEVIDELEHLKRISPNRFEGDQKIIDAWYFHLKTHDKLDEYFLQYLINILHLAFYYKVANVFKS
ncbi:hypothetical protein [Priestia megaterium]|uniref:hypothetical protein n=1 Tax=Priestia megaterium TaxID=1404 RepID=UPI00263B7EB1|nr:hypothetical protein [Priestia megaterium]MDN4862802.1 hypothetical protein [Priestia megaterium]